MCLLQTVMISRKKASEKTKLDPDPIAQEIGDRIDLLNVKQLNTRNCRQQLEENK